LELAVSDRRLLPWWRTPRLALWLILAGAAAFGVTAGAGYRGLQDLAAHAAERRHAEATLALLDKTLALLLDIETGQRGFLLSGNPASLEPYERGKARFPDTWLDLLRHLAIDDPGGAARARHQRLEALVRQRIAIADAHVLKRRAEGPAAGSEAGTDLDGRLAMDAIRFEFETLGAALRERLAALEAVAAQLQARTAALIIALTAGGVALMVGAVWLLVDERRRRDSAEAALRRFSQLLESMVDDRTAELRAARDRMQSFARQLDESIEAERRRLAREVHDQFGQIVTGTKMVVQELARQHPELPPDKVAQLVGLLDESIATARRIASALRPPLLDDLGFAAAVAHFAQRTRLPGRLEVVADVRQDEHLDGDQANQLFRIVQEATTNALRHAQAARIVVSGCLCRGEYVLRIADDGIGPQPVRADASGLRNMRERAAMVGGSFEFGPGAHGGSEVVARIPIVQREEQPA